MASGLRLAGGDVIEKEERLGADWLITSFTAHRH